MSFFSPSAKKVMVAGWDFRIERLQALSHLRILPDLVLRRKVLGGLRWFYKTHLEILSVRYDFMIADRFLDDPSPCLPLFFFLSKDVTIGL